MVLALSLVGCSRSQSPSLEYVILSGIIRPDTIPQDTLTEDTTKEEVSHDLFDLQTKSYWNSVKGHDERYAIAGNFTGKGIDTLYLEELNPKIPDSIPLEDQSKWYWDNVELGDAKRSRVYSNNKRIPPIIIGDTWGIVYEGDIDGDGRDEWGWLSVGFNSQWRTYTVYNFDPKRWRWQELDVDIRFLDVPRDFRESGLELVEPGPEPGLVKFNYSNGTTAIRDTIVPVKYSRPHRYIFDYEIDHGD